MEACRMRALLVYLISTGQYFSVVRTDDFMAFEAMPDLKEMCPYSNFCGLNASKEFLYYDNLIPCCYSCSCKPDCGYHGDCCYSHLDEYKSIKELMVCRNTFEIDPEADKNYNKYISEPVPHYWMVNKCNRMSDESGFKGETFDGTNMSFSPVFSENTGVIYYNSLFAMCNNVSDVKPWQRILSCPKNAETFLSDIMTNPEVGQTVQKCISYFSPPDTQVNFKQCYTNTIRQCNVTGQLTVKNEYWPLCDSFNSTFIITNSRFYQSFANVYCYICNSENVYKSGIGKRKCNHFRTMDYKTPLLSGASLTIVLNLGQEISQASDLRQRDGQCGRNSHMIRSFTNSCRPIRCPTGQILFNGKCDFYSKKWIGGPFAAMLRLSPMRKDAYLSTSTLVSIMIQNRSNNRASWIQRNTLRRWNLTVFYHPFKYTSEVEYITVKAMYPFRSVNPKLLMGSVKYALQDIWTIEHMNFTFSFSVDFNEYDAYSRVTEPVTDMLNITRYDYYPHSKTSCNLAKIEELDYKHILYSISNINREDLNDGIFLTKMFYCNQVELLPEEFEFTRPPCKYSLHFKVKNTTINRFTMLPELDAPSILSTMTSVNRVLVCLQEFGMSNNDKACMYGTFYTLVLLFSFKQIIC